MSCGARAEPRSCQTHPRQEPSVLNRTLDCTALGGVSCFQTHTLQARSQSGLIHYGFFHMQEKNKGYKCPRHGSTSGSFMRPLGSEEMPFKKLLLCKKRKKNYKSYKIPLNIHRTYPQVNAEGTSHLSKGSQETCSGVERLSSRGPESPSLAGGPPGKKVWLGLPSPPRNRQLFHG